MSIHKRNNGTSKIPLRGRGDIVKAWVIVDEEDYEWASRHRWHLHPDGYAARCQFVWRDGRKSTKSFMMHRELLGLEHGDRRVSDHINRNRLDNRRENLRIVTRTQNGQNTGGQPNTSSRYRGVTWDKREKRWMAQAILHGKRHWLGYHETEEEAGEAAAQWRRENMPYAVEDAA